MVMCLWYQMRNSYVRNLGVTDRYLGMRHLIKRSRRYRFMVFDPLCLVSVNNRMSRFPLFRLRLQSVSIKEDFRYSLLGKVRRKDQKTHRKTVKHIRNRTFTYCGYGQK